MGRTPRDYLRHLRLERARALLAKTDEAVAEIGVQAGFGEPAYFTRVFHDATGMTPSAYRRRWRDRRDPALDSPTDLTHWGLLG